MFSKKLSEFDLNSKQMCKNLVRSCAVEEVVADMQEAIGMNPYRDLNL